MSASRTRAVAALRREYEKRGWRVESTRGGHLRWTSPGGIITFTSVSPSDHRAIKNIEARLKRVEREESSK